MPVNYVQGDACTPYMQDKGSLRADGTRPQDKDATVGHAPGTEEWISDMFSRTRLNDPREEGVTKDGSQVNERLASDVASLSELSGNCLTDGFLQHVLRKNGGQLQVPGSLPALWQRIKSLSWLGSYGSW